MPWIKQFLSKYRRLLSWVGGLLLTYTLLGFFFVPWIAEQQIVKLLKERLELNTQVESIYFNPYSFFAEIQGLSISEEDGSEFLLLDNVYANFQASRLAALKFQFSEAVISGLDVYLQRTSTTENNLADLIQRWESSSTQAADDPIEDEEPAGDLIPLEVISLQVNNLTIHLLDEVPVTPFTTSVTLANASIGNISTLPGQMANNSLTVYLEQDAVLSWSGAFSLNPLNFTGAIALENFSLNTISRYLQNTIPVTIDDGRLAASFNYGVDLATEVPQIDISEIFLTLRELQVQQSTDGSVLLAVNEISASAGQVLLPDNSLVIESLSLDSFDLNLVRDSGGELNLQQILNDFSANSGADSVSGNVVEPQATLSRPWLITLENFVIENSHISVSDQSLEDPFILGATVNASITGINNEAQTSMPLFADLELDSGGEITAQGIIQVLPELDVNVTLAVNDVSLTPFQPYINEFANIELQRGLLSLDAELVVNADEPFSYNGGFNLQSMEFSDQQLDETLLTLDRLVIDSVNYSLARNQVAISDVLVDSMFARVIVHRDGSTNVGRSIKLSPDQDQSPPDDDSSAAELAPGIAISVGRVRIDNARFNFTDENLPIVFDATIQGLSGVVEGFSTNSSQPMVLDLEGQVDEFGLVQINSSLNPFNIAQQSQIDLVFTNLDMPAMTPYFIKFAGREIADGRVDVNLAYSIAEGELQANNQVVLHDLQLGQRVEHPDAMDLPLDLAIALLKDSNGVIDLQVPVTGNLNEPEFSFRPAIQQAISSIFENIVSAPFRLLGNLIGGNSNDLDSIKFLPGRSDIASPEQQTLQQLHAALLQRPQLSLEIPPVSGEADILALQTTAIDNRIEGIIQLGDSEIFITDRRLAATELLYNQAALTPATSELRILHSKATTSSTETDQNTNNSGTIEVTDNAANPLVNANSLNLGLDSLAYTADLRNRLISAESISETQLATLAESRKDEVISFIEALGDIDRSRLSSLEAISSELDEGGWLTMTFDLTTL